MNVIEQDTRATLVMLNGNPGVGKSWVVESLRERFPAKFATAEWVTTSSTALVWTRLQRRMNIAPGITYRTFKESWHGGVSGRDLIIAALHSDAPSPAALANEHAAQMDMLLSDYTETTLWIADNVANEAEAYALASAARVFDPNLRAHVIAIGKASGNDLDARRLITSIQKPLSLFEAYDSNHALDYVYALADDLT